MGSENTTRTSAASARVSTSPCGAACATASRRRRLRASGHRDERAHHRQEKGRGTLHEWDHLGQGTGSLSRRRRTGARRVPRPNACSEGRLRSEGRGRADTRRGPADTPVPRCPRASNRSTLGALPGSGGDPNVYETVNGAARGQDIHRQIFERNLAVQLLIDPETGRIVEANPRRLRLLRVHARRADQAQDHRHQLPARFRGPRGHGPGHRRGQEHLPLPPSPGHGRGARRRRALGADRGGRTAPPLLDHPRRHGVRARAGRAAADDLAPPVHPGLHDGRHPGHRPPGTHRLLQPALRPDVADPARSAGVGRRREGDRLRGRAAPRPRAVPAEDPAGLRAAGRGELRRPGVQGRPGLRALLDPADARRAAGRPRLELPRRHRTPPRGSRAARVRGQLPPALREPPHADVGLRPARPPLPRGQRVGGGALRLLARRAAGHARHRPRPGGDGPADPSALHDGPGALPGIEAPPQGRQRDRRAGGLARPRVRRAPGRSRAGPGHHGEEARGGSAAPERGEAPRHPGGDGRGVLRGGPRGEPHLLQRRALPLARLLAGGAPGRRREHADGRREHAQGAGRVPPRARDRAPPQERRVPGHRQGRHPARRAGLDVPDARRQGRSPGLPRRGHRRERETPGRGGAARERGALSPPRRDVAGRHRHPQRGQGRVRQPLRLPHHGRVAARGASSASRCWSSSTPSTTPSSASAWRCSGVARPCRSSRRRCFASTALRSTWKGRPRPSPTRTGPRCRSSCATSPRASGRRSCSAPCTASPRSAPPCRTCRASTRASTRSSPS